MTNILSRQQRRHLARQSQKHNRNVEKLNRLNGHATIYSNFESEFNVQAEKGQGWVPKGTVVDIAGKLVRGLVYVGKPPLVKTTFGEKQRCEAYIDTSLPISDISNQTMNSTSNSYATYSTLNPMERNKYLDWLVAGKTREHFDPRFTKIYFLGLERRLLADNPTTQDVADILMELTMLSDNFRIHNLQFIKELQDYYYFTTNIAPYYEKAIKSDFVTDPMVTKVEGSLKALNDELLGYQYFYCYLVHSDHEEIENVRLKYPLDFELMFKSVFEKKFPSGLPNYCEEEPMYREYQSISNEISCEDYLRFNGHNLPSYLCLDFYNTFVYPTGRKIANKLSREKRQKQKSQNRTTQTNFIGSNYIRLPNSNPKHQNQVIKKWKERILKKKSEVSVYDVLKFTSTSEPQGEFTKQQWERAVNKFLHSGFVLVPEQSLFMDYANFDDSITLIELDLKNNEWKKSSKNYFSVLLSVALGFLIFSKDGSLTKKQQSTIEMLINKSHGLKPSEKKRLSHNFQRMLKSPPFPKFVSRLGHYKKLINPNVVRPFLVKCASMSYLNNAKTVSLMESIYKRIGIDTALVYSDLHEEESTSQHPENRKKQREIRELDFDKIKRIRNETEQVSEVLGGIFNEQQELVTSDNSNLVGKIGLDYKHEMLVRILIEKPNWTVSEFDQFAKQQGLFPAGALESINEWAFEKFDGPLIDNHEGYQIEADIVEKLSTLV